MGKNNDPLLRSHWNEEDIKWSIYESSINLTKHKSVEIWKDMHWFMLFTFEKKKWKKGKHGEDLLHDGMENF